MKDFCTRSKFFNLTSGIPAIFWLFAGLSGSGCDGGERDLFTTGFNCEIPIHVNHSTCGLASGAVSFVSSNTSS